LDYSSIKAHFDIKEEHGDKCKAICPAHADKQASLSITYDPVEKKTLVKCHAGCETIDVMAAVGLKVTDLFDLQLIKKDNPNNNIEAVYKYHDIDGNILFEKVRFKGKKFSQRRYEGESVIWGLDGGTFYETFEGSNNWSTKKRENVKTREFSGIEPVIYNLPGVVKAIEDGQPIFIVEGEKDSDNLIKLDITATTSFDGASKGKPKWRKDYNKHFKDANVILIPDNDKPGMAHMEYIAKELQDIAKSIKLLELNDLEEKQDSSDWLEKGHDKEELLELIKNTMEYEFNKVDILSYNFSDVGNAERLVAIHGKNIKFNPLQQKWMLWSGKHWQIDESLQIERLAKDIIKRVQRAGENLTTNDEEYMPVLEKYKKKIESFVLKSEGDPRIKAMLNQSKSQNNVMMVNTDEDIFSLNILNGTFDLKTGEIKDHNRSHNITKLINITYDSNKDCPNWKSFLDRIFLGDKELIEYIQKTIGYSLTGSMTEQCFYMCYGGGANGKSTFLNTIQKILGDYSDTLKGSSLMVKRNDDGARGDLAKLKGKRFVIASELNEGQTFDESLLKALTGGDIVPVRYLYGEDFPLIPQFKLWIGTNEKPKVKGTNLGIWRRVRLIPFLYTFKEEDKDPNFYEKFIEPELDGILNWAVEGCLKWQKEGIEIPQKVMMAVEEYQNEMDSIGRFLEECCMVGNEYSVKASLLYDEYVKWCSDNREHEISNVKFSKKITEKGFEKSRKTSAVYYSGIGLVDDNFAGYKEVDNKIFPFQTKFN
jgi:putative DNA primase/helicase